MFTALNVRVSSYRPAPAEMPGSGGGCGLLQFATVLGFALAVTLVATSADAQCREGDYLVGEDDQYWYCAPPASDDAIETVLKDLDDLKKTEQSELLGEEWRLRKTVIDTAGCMARNAWQYVYGGRITVPEICMGSRDLGVDCSGMVAYASRYAACAINGFYRVAFNKLRSLEDSAAGQANLFRVQNAFLPPDATPTAGDLIFFGATYDRNGDGKVDQGDGVTHVAIYLGTQKDGTILMIHASAAARKVVITPMPTNLIPKVVGYGNLSRLYVNLNTP